MGVRIINRPHAFVLDHQRQSQAVDQFLGDTRDKGFLLGKIVIIGLDYFFGSAYDRCAGQNKAIKCFLGTFSQRISC
jgi:hypothetical protein